MKNNAIFFILCFLITSSFATLHSGFAAGTLVKVPRGYTPIENLHVGDFVYSVTPNRTYNLAQITHTTSYSLPAAIKIITKHDVIITTPQQRFYLPREQKWITTNQISSSCHLGTGKAPCTTKFKIQPVHTVTDFFDIRLNNFHTFCVSTDDIIVHNFPLCFIGFTIAWGTGKICFDGIYAGICLAGFWIGTKLLKNKSHNNHSNFKIKGFISGSGAPDPNDDNWKKEHPYGSYIESPKHHSNTRGRIGKPPRNGQVALDNSFEINESPHRIAVQDNNIVVLRLTRANEFHGYIEENWHNLCKEAQKTLRNSGYNFHPKTGKLKL